MTVKTRKEIREQLAVLLSAALTGVGNPAQAVYDYLKPDFARQSPVITMASISTNAEEQDFTNWMVTHKYEILVFVAREDEQIAEDALDSMVQGVYETLQTNRVLDGWWDDLAWASESDLVSLPLSGNPYWVETIPITVLTYE